MDKQNNKVTTYVLGGLIGAAIGVVAAFLMDRSAQIEGGQGPTFNKKKVQKTAMGVIQLLWSLIEKGR